MENTTTQDTRRRPGVALFLSLVMGGLGHVYCGRIVRGIVLIVVGTLLGTGVSALLVPTTAWRTFGVVSLALGIAVWIYAIVDARRIVRKTGPDYVLKDYNRWYVYLLLLLMTLPVSVGYSFLIRRHVVKAFRIVGRAMTPTLCKGDRVLVSKFAYHTDPVQRGDIVAFPHPNDRRRKYIRRVVALAGDTVEMRNGQLYVNDRKLECTEVDASESSDSGEKICEEVNDVARYRVIPNAPPDSEVDALRDFPRMTVPNGHCFVLGDNRNRSLDSRSFGPVRLADILGRVDRVWYPRWEKLSPREGDD